MQIHRGILVWALACAVVAPTGAAPVPRPMPEQVRKEFDALWNSIHGTDELAANRAMFKLAARPDAIAYLKERLRPLKLSPERLKTLLAGLGDENEKKAQAAYDELAHTDPRLILDEEHLRDTLLKVDNLTARRLGAVLCDLPIDTFVGVTWHWYSPDNKCLRFSLNNEPVLDVPMKVANIDPRSAKKCWSGAIRVLSILEQIGTPEAIAVVEDFAMGHPDAAPTKTARRVLDRTKKK